MKFLSCPYSRNHGANSSRQVGRFSPDMAASRNLRLLLCVPHGPADTMLLGLLPKSGAVFHQEGAEGAPILPGQVHGGEGSKIQKSNNAGLRLRQLEERTQNERPRSANVVKRAVSQDAESPGNPEKEETVLAGRHGVESPTGLERHGSSKRRPGSLRNVAGNQMKGKKIHRGQAHGNARSILARQGGNVWSSACGLRRTSLAELIKKGPNRSKPAAETDIPTVPPWQAPCKAGSMAKAKDLVLSGKLDGVLHKFKQNYFAESSRRSRECKRKEVLDLAVMVNNGRAVIPLRKDIVEGTAAAMKHAEMKSGVQYLTELKLLHIEAGFDISPALQRTFDLCKKSLERNRGPTKRAAEVKLKKLEGACRNVKSQKKSWPEWPILAFLWGAVWMLREIELRRMKSHHVRLEDKLKQVTIWIPLSKCDQKGEGVKRTLACCKQSPCLVTCPWKLAVDVLAKSRKIRSMGDATLIKSSNGSSVTKAGMIAAWKKQLGDEVSGHSPRRSGAMHYVRCGLQIQELAFLGRWKSSVVLNYAEEAPQETAVRIPGQDDDGPKETSANSTPRIPSQIDVPDSPEPRSTSARPLPEKVSIRAQDEVSPVLNNSMTNIFNTPKNLWVITKGRGSRSRPANVGRLPAVGSSLRNQVSSLSWSP